MTKFFFFFFSPSSDIKEVSSVETFCLPLSPHILMLAFFLAGLTLLLSVFSKAFLSFQICSDMSLPSTNYPSPIGSFITLKASRHSTLLKQITTPAQGNVYSPH